MKMFTTEEDNKIIAWCGKYSSQGRKIYDNPGLTEMTCSQELLNLSFSLEWSVAAICLRIVELTVANRI